MDRPAVTAVLNEQYRMNETITCLANRLSYNGKLKCANDSISKATVQIRKQVKLALYLLTITNSNTMCSLLNTVNKTIKINMLLRIAVIKC